MFQAPSTCWLRLFLAERLASRRKPAIIVTHDVRDAKTFGARLYVLEEGSVKDVGTAAEVAARSASPFVAEFFGTA